MTGDALRLVPELIPEPLWYLSAARLLGHKRKAWRRIRADALDAARNTCSACGAEVPRGRRMVCDEVWAYDEPAAMASLTGFRVRCQPCDGARHFGMSQAIGHGDDARDRLLTVNEMDEKTVTELLVSAASDFQRRSKIRWSVRVSPTLLVSYPQLACLDGLQGSPGEGRQRRATAHSKVSTGVADSDRLEREA